jgi:hypothetical protein
MAREGSTQSAAMNTDNPSTRARNVATALLKRGECNPTEAANLAGTSQQLAYWWAKQAGIDPVEARKNRLARIWNEELERQERRLSSATARRRA